MYSYHYLLDLPKTKSPATFLNITIVTGWFDSFPSDSEANSIRALDYDPTRKPRKKNE